MSGKDKPSKIPKLTSVVQPTRRSERIASQDSQTQSVPKRRSERIASRDIQSTLPEPNSDSDLENETFEDLSSIVETVDDTIIESDSENKIESPLSVASSENIGTSTSQENLLKFDSTNTEPNNIIESLSKGISSEKPNTSDFEDKLDNTTTPDSISPDISLSENNSAEPSTSTSIVRPSHIEQSNIMALTSTQLVDIIPKCTSEEDVEQFVAIVDKLFKQIKAEDMPIFLAIVTAKVQKKAYDAIKGITIDTWNSLKDALTKGLEQKIDRATATNRLMHIKQKKDEKLKDYTGRVKDALAVLNRATIREIAEEESRKCLLEQNDAIAKNTFESGIKDDKLKTIVVASKEKTFNDSHNCAVNQQQTNFPTEESKTSTSKDSLNKITCFYCQKPNHTANECFKKFKDTRSKSLSPNSNRYQSNNYNRNGNFGQNRTNSFTNRNIDSTQNSNRNTNFTGNGRFNSYNNANNERGAQTSNNSNRSNYNANNRGNWNRNTNSNTNSGNSNRNSANGTNMRVLREENVDWDEIVPFNDDQEEQGN